MFCVHGKLLYFVARIAQLIAQYLEQLSHKHGIMKRDLWLRIDGKVAVPRGIQSETWSEHRRNGMARLETLSFDAYNELDVLIIAIKWYRERIGYYPERVLADMIYRNRENRVYCKLHGIRLSDLSYWRSKKNVLRNKKTEYMDNTDHAEVKRSISLAKRCHGLSRMTTLELPPRVPSCCPFCWWMFPA